jgi:hypothetical protein
MEQKTPMAELFIAAVIWVATIVSAAPVDTPHESEYFVLLMILMFRSIRSTPSQEPADPGKLPRKYAKMADSALYFGFNTIKIGVGLGMLTIVLTATERLARWLYRHVRGSITYWKDEIRDLKNGGLDPDQTAWEKDEFVNESDEPEPWEPSYHGRKNRIELLKKKNYHPRPGEMDFIE